MHSVGLAEGPCRFPAALEINGELRYGCFVWQSYSGEAEISTRVCEFPEAAEEQLSHRLFGRFRFCPVYLGRNGEIVERNGKQIRFELQRYKT